MGLGVTASAGIIFIALIISVASVWEAHDVKDEMVREARDGYLERQRSLLDTTLSFTDARHYPAPANVVNITIKNNGSNPLDLRFTDVYLNGLRYNNSYQVYSFAGNMMNKTYICSPGETANITIANAGIAKPIHIRVTVQNGYGRYTTIN